MALLLQKFGLLTLDGVEEREGGKKQTWSEPEVVKLSKQNGAACNTQMD